MKKLKIFIKNLNLVFLLGEELVEMAGLVELRIGLEVG